MSEWGLPLSRIDSSPQQRRRRLADPVLRRHLSYREPSWLIRRIMYRDLAAAAQLAGGSLLDVGSAKSPYRGLFPQVERYVSVDYPNVNHPAEQADVYGNGLDLPFADQSFDTVLCTQVIEHVPEPARLLAEIARVLRPGGLLLLTAPHIWELHEEPFDFYRYTRHGLAYLLDRAGFDVGQIQPQGGFFVMIAQRLSYFAARLLPRLRAARLIAPAAFAINSLGWWLDLAHTYTPETLNYQAIARRRGPAKD